MRWSDSIFTFIMALVVVSIIFGGVYLWIIGALPEINVWNLVVEQEYITWID